MKKKTDMTVSQKVTELRAARGKKSASGAHFFREIKEEMKRVSWTSPQELRSSSKIVIGAIFGLGLSIYLADLMIRLFLSGLSNLMRLIGG